MRIWLVSEVSRRVRLYKLAFSLLGITAPIQDCQGGRSFHQTRGRISKEFALRFQATINTYVVFRNHVKVARFGRVVRSLFGDVVSSCVVIEVPVAGEDFAKDRIQWLLDSRGTDMPTAEVELDDGDKSFNGIINSRYW